MKKKIFAIFCISMLSVSLLVGCGNKTDLNDTTGQTTTVSSNDFVIENDNIKVATYKGLSVAPYEEVTDEQVQAFINYNLEYYYSEKETNPPTYADLTDEMVANLTYGEYIHVEDYVEFTRNLMEEQNREYYKENYSDILFRDVVSASVLKNYTDEELQEYIDYANNYFEEYAANLGIPFETYRKENLGFETEDEYNEYIKNESLDNLKTKFIIEAIADAENIVITQDDIEAEIEEYMEYNGFESREAVLEFVSEEDIIVNLKYYKVLDIIFSESVATAPDTETAN